MILHLDLDLNLDLEGMVIEGMGLHNTKTLICAKEATNETS